MWCLAASRLIRAQTCSRLGRVDRHGYLSVFYLKTGVTSCVSARRQSRGRGYACVAARRQFHLLRRDTSNFHKMRPCGIVCCPAQIKKIHSNGIINDSSSPMSDTAAWLCTIFPDKEAMRASQGSSFIMLGFDKKLARVLYINPDRWFHTERSSCTIPLICCDLHGYSL